MPIMRITTSLEMVDCGRPRSGRWALLRSFARRGVDHKKEALLGCRKLGYVVFRVRSSDVLLHRAIPLLLMI